MQDNVNSYDPIAASEIACRELKNVFNRVPQLAVEWTRDPQLATTRFKLSAKIIEGDCKDLSLMWWLSGYPEGISYLLDLYEHYAYFFDEIDLNECPAEGREHAGLTVFWALSQHEGGQQLLLKLFDRYPFLFKNVSLNAMGEYLTKSSYGNELLKKIDDYKCSFVNQSHERSKTEEQPAKRYRYSEKSPIQESGHKRFREDERERSSSSARSRSDEHLREVKRVRAYANILDYAINFPYSRYSDDECQHKFFEGVGTYLSQDKSPANALQFLLIQLEKSKKDPKQVKPFFEQFDLLLTYVLRETKDNSFNLGRYLATILHKLAKIRDTRINIKPQTLSTLLSRLSRQKQITAQAIANTIWGLGKLSENKETAKVGNAIAADDLKFLINKLCEMNEKEITAQHTANTIWGLGKLVENKETAKVGSTIAADDLKDLIHTLRKMNEKEITAQAIANTIGGLGKFAENKETAKVGSTIAADDLKELIHTLRKINEKEIDAQAIANTIWGLGRLAENKETAKVVSTIAADDLKGLINMLCKMNEKEITAQEIASTIWGLGKLAENKETMKVVSTLAADDLKGLIHTLCKMNKEEISTQAIANTIWGLGRLAENKEMAKVVSTIAPYDLKGLIHTLRKMNEKEIIAQHIANTIWGLGKLAENKETAKVGSTIAADDLKGLIHTLCEMNKEEITAQHIANTIWGLGKLAENKETAKLCKDIAVDDLKDLIHTLRNMSEKEIDAQHIANTIGGLGKLAENKETAKLCKDIAADDLKGLIHTLCKMNEKEIKAQEIANTIWGLGKLAESPEARELCTYISVEDMTTLLNKKGNIKDILSMYQILSGLAALKRVFPAFPEELNACILSLTEEWFRHSKKLHQRRRVLSRSIIPLRVLQKITMLKNILILDKANKFYDKSIELINTLIRLRLTPYALKQLVEIINEHKDNFTHEMRHAFHAYIVKVIEDYPQSIRTKIESLITFIDESEAPDALLLPATETMQEIEQEPALKKLSLRDENIKFSYHLADYSREIYSISEKEKLEKRFNTKEFTYDFSVNKTRTRVKLHIAPVAVLSASEHIHFGLFAGEALSPSDRTIGCYAGERLSEEEAQGKNTAYMFDIEIEGDPVTILDAQKKGDWTRFLNHSFTPNTSAKEKKIKEEANIYFYLCKDVKPTDQLFINYGTGYFSGENIKVPYYLHTSDNWKTPKNIYEENRGFYAETYFGLNKPFSNKIGQDCHSCYWLMPKLVEAIVETDEPLEALTQIELPSYAISKEEGEVARFEHQQHITPLMMACYLGKEKWIDALLAKGADPGRSMLRSGHNSLMLLLMSDLPIEKKEDIGLKMLKSKTLNPFLITHNNLTALHYAIEANAEKLVFELLKIANKQEENVFEEMYERDIALPKHHTFEDYCDRNPAKADVLQNHLKSLSFIYSRYVEYAGEMQEKQTLHAVEFPMSKTRDLTSAGFFSARPAMDGLSLTHDLPPPLKGL